MNPKFLHAANPGPMTGEGNWTYLIGDKHPVLIDAGVGNQSHLDPKLPWQRLDDGDVVGTDEGDLHALLAPGHAPDHLTFWHADSRTLFVGDMLVLGSTVVIPASLGGSLSEYLRSLERMVALNPARALPAHGPVIEDPLALIQKYVEHRAQREGQVLDALASS